MPLQYCQGDLLFLWQDRRQAVELSARQSHVIVAGETSGHAHRLQTSTIWDEPDGAPYLDMVDTTQVVYEEHQPITLAPGCWLVGRQQEDIPEALQKEAD